MEEKQFKEALDRWLTREPPTEDEEDYSFENGMALAYDNVIKYLERKKLNFSAQKRLIDGIIKYIFKLRNEIGEE